MYFQIALGFSRGGSNLIVDVMGQLQGKITLGHIIHIFPLLLVCTSSTKMHDGPIDNPPDSRGLEEGFHLGSPFQIVCPIKDGDVGVDSVELSCRSPVMKTISMDNIINIEVKLGI